MAGAAAEHLGVIADPEITEHRLSPEAPLLILASDGVFEFLSNQSVVDMVSLRIAFVNLQLSYSASLRFRDVGSFFTSACKDVPSSY